MYSLSLITPPAVEPVSLTAVKQFCTIDPSFTDDDQLLQGFISAARAEAENYASRAFFNQQWRLSLDRFPMYWGQNTIKNISDSYFPYQYFFDGLTIRLPKPKCVSVDSITYVDESGTQRTLYPSSYFVDLDSEPARIIPYPGSFWPTISAFIPGSVKITFTCGSYGDGIEVNTCPGTVVTAISLLAAHFYGNREGTTDIPDAFYRLLDGERFEVFGYGY